MAAVPQSAVARVVGIETIFRDLRAGGILFLPQRVALVGQGSSLSVYSTDKFQITSATQAASIYGFGSPIHLAARQLFPVNGDGVGTIPVTVYPLVDDGSGAPSVGDIAPGGAQTEAAAYIVRVNNIDSEAFVIEAADTVANIVTAMAAAVNAVLEMPVIAVDATPGTSTQVDLTSKWEGTSANDIIFEVVGSATAGTTFAITQPVGGLVNPNIDAALAQVGGVWESMFLNCLDIADTVTLDKLDTFAEGRWGSLVRKPVANIFTGNTATTVAAATVVSDARKTDRNNGQLVAPGSNDLPFVVAARELARIVVVADSDPPFDYARRSATGLTPGTDGEQWTTIERDQAVKAGSSTVEVSDRVINLSDTVSFYHPTGDPLPAYRFVVDKVKLQQVLFNLDLIFATEEWDGAPLVPDDQPISLSGVKKPKMAVADVAAMIDSLALNAIISDPETAKKSITAQINAQNPKRLDISLTIQLAGNANIISIENNFGFFFGPSVVIA